MQCADRGMHLLGRGLGTAPCLGACTKYYHLPPAQSHCPKKRRRCPKGMPTQGSRFVQDQGPFPRLGPLFVQGSPSYHVLGGISGLITAPELEAFLVSAQTLVSELEALQFLTQLAQCPNRGPFQPWLRCFLILAGVSSENRYPSHQLDSVWGASQS